MRMFVSMRFDERAQVLLCMLQKWLQSSHMGIKYLNKILFLKE